MKSRNRQQESCMYADRLGGGGNSKGGLILMRKTYGGSVESGKLEGLRFRGERLAGEAGKEKQHKAATLEDHLLEPISRAERRTDGLFFLKFIPSDLPHRAKAVYMYFKATGVIQTRQ